MASGETFALQVAKFCEKAKGNADDVLRKVLIDMSAEIVERSPVGNPELWAANAHAAYGRATHNMFVDAFNADINANAANFTKRGNLKRGVKRAKRLSQKKLVEAYPLVSGKGYVGGRFRANWVMSVGTLNTSTTEQTDAAGAATKARLQSFAIAAEAGNVYYLQNNLPYAIPLEYGHSTKQAPLGVVGVTTYRFREFVRNAVAGLDK